MLTHWAIVIQCARQLKPERIEHNLILSLLDIMRNNFRSNSEWPFAVPHAEIV
jgi:hypothetical protein